MGLKVGGGCSLIDYLLYCGFIFREFRVCVAIHEGFIREINLEYPVPALQHLDVPLSQPSTDVYLFPSADSILQVRWSIIDAIPVSTSTAASKEVKQVLDLSSTEWGKNPRLTSKRGVYATTSLQRKAWINECAMPIATVSTTASSSHLSLPSH